MKQQLICDVNAIQLAERASHQALTDRLFQDEVREVREVGDGYGFQFSESLFEDLCLYVKNERLCCPFFHFEIVVNAARGPIWLNLRGPDGIKAFIAQELNLAEQHERDEDWQ